MKALSFHVSEPSKVSGFLTLVQTVLGGGLFSKIKTLHNKFMNSHKKSCLLGLLLLGSPRPLGPFGLPGWESGSLSLWLCWFEVSVRMSVSLSDPSESGASGFLLLNMS